MVRSCHKCNVRPKLPYHHSWCKVCRNAWDRGNRIRYGQLPMKERKKSIVRAYTNVLVKRGILKRKPCEVCNDPDVMAFHTDPKNARKVRWLCKPHHREAGIQRRTL